MKFEKSNKSYEIYGESYNVRLPSVKESQEYGDKVKDKSETESVGELMLYLEKLGLPQIVSESMEEKHFIELAKDLFGSEKK